MSPASSLTTFVFAAAVLATSVAAGSAQEPGVPGGERLFQRYDSNRDGKITVDELKPRTERRFLRLDTDGDERVTVAEIDAWLTRIMERRRDRILSTMDKNGDGAVDRGELAERISALFTEADANSDGGVTLEESRTYHAERRRAFFAELRKRRQKN